jgi:hypothetical protein
MSQEKSKFLNQQDELLQLVKQQSEQIEQLKSSLDQASQLISLKFKEKNVSIVNLDKVVKEIKRRNNPNVQLHDLGTTKPEDIFISYEENGFLHVWSYGLK